LKINKGFFPFLAILVLTLACSLTPATQTPASRTIGSPTPKTGAPTTATLRPTATRKPAAGVTPTLTQAAANDASQPTITAAPTNTLPPQNQNKAITYRGVAFNLPKTVAQGAAGQITPADPADPSVTGWPGPVPDFYAFSFDGYILSNTFHTPQVLVYPVKAYASVNPPAGEIAAQLDAILKQTAGAHKDMPFLPMWNAAQVLAAADRTVDFKNGSGIRYLAYYSQSTTPINNDGLFYTYQGLTSDGEFYISAIFPVQQPGLNSPALQKEYDAAQTGSDPTAYETYLWDVKTALEGDAPGSFTPSLDQLDALVQSLEVHPAVALKAPAVPTQTTVCQGAMPTRLAKGKAGRVAYTDGTQLNVRQSPGKSGKVVGALPEGNPFTVVDGPSCVNNQTWWQIKADTAAGWILEADGNTYLVEPR
jgi:hypothetical protein